MKQKIKALDDINNKLGPTFKHNKVFFFIQPLLEARAAICKKRIVGFFGVSEEKKTDLLRLIDL